MFRILLNFIIETDAEIPVILKNVKRSRAHENTIYHCLYGFFYLGYQREELAKIYGKSKTTICTWINDFKDKNSVGRTTITKRVFKKFNLEKRSWLVELYKKRPILYQEEASQMFHEHFGLTISTSSVSVILFEAGLTYKVLEQRARQIRITEVLRFCEDMNSFKWILHNLVFLDEVSFDGKDAIRRRGFGEKGRRTIYQSEFSRGKRVSLLCFLGVDGIKNTYMSEGTFNRAKFLQCCRQFATDYDSEVRQYPGPYSVWIMDGAKIHTDPHLITYLRSLGIYIIFLPPYCPFYNPIEFIFGYLKRKMQQLNKNNLSKKDMFYRVSDALRYFEKMDCSAVFKKCGYFPNGTFNPASNFDLERDSTLTTDE